MRGTNTKDSPIPFRQAVSGGYTGYEIESSAWYQEEHYMQGILRNNDFLGIIP